MRKYLIWFTALLATACAQVVAPKGGPFDREAPKILSSTPIIGQINYNEARIELVFDEYVQVQQLAQELISSPPLKNPPDYILKQKKLIFTWKDSLLPNTTYYFNFGKSISDLNEGNKLDSNIMVFSTGESIDSLVLKGKVINAETLQPEKDMFVMLYPQMGDSIPCKERPTYFAKTNEQGEFSIGYIKEAVFQIFALRDNNNNYLFDLPNEHIAFSNNLIIPIYKDSSVSLPNNFILKAFTENREKQYLKDSKEEQAGKIVLGFNLPVKDSLYLKSLNGAFEPNQYTAEWSLKKDSLTLWIPNTEGLDTLQLEIAEGNTVLDTISLLISKYEAAETVIEEKKGRSAKNQKKANAVSLKISTSGDKNQFGAHDTFFITSNHPIKAFQKANFQLLIDSVTQAFELVPRGLRTLELRVKWTEEAPYHLHMLPGAITDMYDLSNDSLHVSFKPKSAEDYGFLYVFVDMGQEKSNYIIELLDGEKLMESRLINKSDTLSFEYLKPGAYKLKAIVDENDNGKWDPGIFGEKKQAENIFFYRYNADVKANWDTEMHWKLEEYK